MNTEVIASPTPPALRQLSELPGPRPWPIVGNSLQITVSKFHLDLERWGREYGPMIQARLGSSQFLIVSDHELISDILRDRPEGFIRPNMLRETVLEMRVGREPGVFLAEGEMWQKQRRMVMASFSPANVRRYFPSLLKVTQRLHGRWNKAADAGTVIDLQADLMRFTVDAISGLAFGKDINTLESQEEIIQHHLDKIFPAIYRRTSALIPYWRYFKLPVDRALDRSIKTVIESIREFVAQARERLQADPSLREFPQNLLEAMIVAADEPDSGMNDHHVAGNVFTMLLAGEDTTATTLSWMIYLLFRNPQAMARAREEARRVAGELGEFTPENMAELNYIEACAHEVMRLKPVGPYNVLEAKQDRVVGDVAVPKGTMLMLVIRNDALNERYFTDAKAFNPQRWLDGDHAGSATNAKRVSMPFGGGPRICPGRYLAMLEIKMAMAMFLNEFDIVSVGTPDGGEAQEKMSFTMVPVGLTMRIRRRAD